jgi:hypothetical protein
VSIFPLVTNTPSVALGRGIRRAALEIVAADRDITLTPLNARAAINRLLEPVLRPHPHWNL